MRKRNRKNIWNNNYWEFPQVNVRHQTIYPGSTEKTKQDRFQKKKKKAAPRHIIFKLEEIKDKDKKFWKKPEGKKLLLMEEQR